MNRPEAIKTFLLKKIPKHPADIVAIASSHFNVTRTTIHRHLSTLLKQQKIINSGTTRDMKYYLVDTFDREMKYKITPDLSEDKIFIHDFDKILKPLPENIYDICAYVMTELINNAIDHSHGTSLTVSIKLENNYIKIIIADNGIGIFKNLYDYFHLDDIRESILQLNKGKMTTDPINHSGEGLFFSARACDVFEIMANQTHFYKNNLENDWSIFSEKKSTSGSEVILKIHTDSKNDLTTLFQRYQEPEDYGFERTEILVELSRLANEKLISRSQAKRILRGLDKFKHVTLDFQTVKMVGQGFVDEIFRVYATKHPEMTFVYINANSDVEFMIERGIATAKSK